MRADSLPGAQRVAVDVGLYRAQGVGETADEAGHEVLAHVPTHVGRRVVLEDERPDRAVGQRVGLQRHREGTSQGIGAAGLRGDDGVDAEMRTIDLVAVGDDGDQVATVRQGKEWEVALVTLGVDRAPARVFRNRRPEAGARIARVQGRATGSDRGGPLVGGPGGVDIEDVLEAVSYTHLRAHETDS